MSEGELAADRSDPGVRAAARLGRRRARDRTARVGATLLLAALAVAAPIAAAPATGDPGATVGAVVAALLFVALAAALWPHPWSDAEQRHHELEAIWREVRSDADSAVPWERYTAWAEPSRDSVELYVLSRAPATERIGGAPSPYSRRVVRRLDADDVAAAAEAMEELRAELSERELEAQERHERRLAEAERREHERTVRALDEVAAADLKANEERLERELAKQEAAERRAQAEAVARALRRP